MTRTDLERAAFWGEGVCLSCGHTQSPEDSPSDDDILACEECGAEDVFGAEFLLRVAEFLADGGDGSDGD